jgi:predicted kinase
MASVQLIIDRLREQAKERVRERRASGQDATVAGVQSELARELGFASWPKLKTYVERLSLEQPFHVDLDYYEARANGIASARGWTSARFARW